MPAETGGPCENCTYFVYEEETQDWVCSADMDQDEWGSLQSSFRKSCPYFRYDDEYGIVRKQN